MYRLPNHFSVRRFHLSSWLFLLKWLLVLAGVGSLVWAMVSSDFRLALISTSLFFAALLIGLLHCLISHDAFCPLCHARPIGSGTCAKHRSARRMLGSHQLKVAGNIILNGYFRCPYCGEFTAVKTRRDS